MVHVGVTEAGIYIRLGAPGTPHVVLPRAKAQALAESIMEAVNEDRT